MSSDDLQTSQHGFRSDRQTIGRRFVEIVTASRAKYYGAISEVRYSDRSSALRSLKLWSHLVNALPYLSCTCVIRKGEAYLPLELPAKGRNNRGTFLPCGQRSKACSSPFPTNINNSSNPSQEVEEAHMEGKDCTVPREGG